MTDQRPVLVTGGCGFVGASLCELLIRSGQRVVVFDDLRSGSPNNWAPDVREEIELIVGDIRDMGAVEEALARSRPAAIYHLAAIHFIPACEADPAETVSVNVAGSQVVLSASARFEPCTVVLASTGAVYAPASVAHAEDALLAPTDIYGLSKLWMEQAAELHQRRTGASLAIARLFNVVGPGETNPHLVPEIVAQARRGSSLRLGNLTTRRDYIYVGDVAEGLLALRQRADGDACVTCNIGAERAVDGFEVVQLIGNALGRSLNVETDQARMRVSDRPLLESNCERARELLGWSARTTLDEALRTAVEERRTDARRAYAA